MTQSKHLHTKASIYIQKLWPAGLPKAIKYATFRHPSAKSPSLSASLRTSSHLEFQLEELGEKRISSVRSKLHRIKALTKDLENERFRGKLGKLRKLIRNFLEHLGTSLWACTSLLLPPSLSPSTIPLRLLNTSITVQYKKRKHFKHYFIYTANVGKEPAAPHK